VLLTILLLPLLFSSKAQASEATVTITEFSDFQCPYCQQAAVVVEQLRQIYGDNVKFVFKQMPLPFHHYAFKAAQAAVIAQQQGKFWEYHDRLFAARDLSVDALKKMAGEAGLKQKEFNQSLDSDATRAAVEKDIQDAKQLGVRGTPTFFVNGKILRGAATLATLMRAIDGALTRPAGQELLRADALHYHSSCEDSGDVAQANFIKVAFTQQVQAASTTTVGGVTLSPASLDFSYQLVGTTSAQMVETVTNSGTASLTITDISVSGRDRGDFPLSYSFTLPVTVAPGNSIAINVTFTPALPWRAGTRNARLEISERNNSQYVPLSGIGATCLGPVPACSSGCPDSDRDGLNDAWEITGGIDINNDGRIDPVNDVLLPGADPNRADIYLKYDYMVAPTHSHQPPAKAFDQMRAMFTAHGITLHVLAPLAGIPEHQVTTLDPNATSACAGTDFITTQQLRAQYVGNLRYAYHYMVFVHDSTTPHDGSLVANCPIDALCHALPTAGASGAAEILGDDSIISFGAEVDGGGQIGIEFWAATMMHELGHNFGLVHGSLADEGGGCSTNSDCPAPFDECFNGHCIVSYEQCLVKKPNYVSVMNYSYQTGAITPSSTAGAIAPYMCNTDADCGPPTITTGVCGTAGACYCTDDGGPGNNFCYRIDYSNVNYLNLNETTLNEAVGVGGPAGDQDIIWYWNGNPAGALPGVSVGPIDWDNNGNVTDNVTGCTTTLGPSFAYPPYCPDVDANYVDTDQLDTSTDWDKLNLAFQCTAGGSGNGVSNEVGEVTFEWMREHHLLHPHRFVSVSVSPSSPSGLKPVAAGQPGTVRVALLGANNFDVREVEPSSLDLHGAKPLSISFEDVNGDGKLDLVAVFDTSQLKLHPQATVARLTGWLKSNQAFSGEDRITIVH
jgi:predicted DsbA family dithiol-disulfide isomerase